MRNGILFCYLLDDEECENPWGQNILVHTTCGEGFDAGLQASCSEGGLDPPACTQLRMLLQATCIHSMVADGEPVSKEVYFDKRKTHRIEVRWV